jgi:Domain of unknown function (DUF4338)
MDETWILQGRCITSSDIDSIRRLMTENPAFGRSQLSREICHLWNWKNAQGQIKDMACRTLLLKLERKNLLILPARIHKPGIRKAKARLHLPHSQDPIVSDLRDLQPLKVINIKTGTADQNMFSCLLDEHHYLGYKTSVGENLKYMVVDQRERIVACLLFGSAAWKTTPRDTFIGWSDELRQKNINLITNNTRFLILPWVRVPHLASHVLSLIQKRIVNDWMEKYNHLILGLETFVDTTRFKGTCYKAANWICLGATKGRSRNDRFHNIQTSIKDVYFYPLSFDFKKVLGHE